MEKEIAKKMFIYLLKTTKREGIDDLINWLENETDFFTAPASTKYHLSKEGGLLEHSLNVWSELDKEYQLNPSIDPMSVLYFLCEINLIEGELTYKEHISLNSSVIIVSLLHDICKANYYKIDYKNVKNEDGVWERVPYYTTKDEFPIGHSEKSVILAQRFIKLTDEEICAIRWHMGSFEPKDNYTYLNNAFNNCTLALNLHIADLKATYIKEK